MRILLTLLGFAVSLVLTAGAVFFLVIVVAGPHSGILPSSLEAVTLALGWVCVLLVPFFVARRIWHRYAPEHPDMSRND